MPRPGYKQTEEHKRKLREARIGRKYPKISRALKALWQSPPYREKVIKALTGKPIEERNHKPNCQCPPCKAKRGERFLHKPNCPCCFCKAKRREPIQHKPNCLCFVCEARRNKNER